MFMIQRWDGTRWRPVLVPFFDCEHNAVRMAELLSEEGWQCRVKRNHRKVVAA